MSDLTAINCERGKALLIKNRKEIIVIGDLKR